MDYWRKFFRCVDADIFEVIEKAILVAASDHPEEFRRRRDRIAEKLYAVLLRRCDRCDPLELQGVEREEGIKVGEKGIKVGEKEIKVGSSIGDLQRSNNPAVLSDCTHADEAEEGLSGHIEEEEGQTNGGGILQGGTEEKGHGVGEISKGETEEEQGQINAGEILRIKGILGSKDDESDAVLLGSLRRLQQMEMTVDLLRATEIGKTVNGIHKCSKSKQIRQLARAIIGGWKVVVDEWISANAAITDTQEPHPMDDKGGLPSPPLEEGRAVLQVTADLRNMQECDSMQKSEQRHRGKDEIVKRSCASARPMKNIANEQNVGSNAKANPPQRKPLAVIQDVSKEADESSMKARLEIAKRKLREGYQRAENAKKQRTIKILELSDIPKHGQHNLNIKISSKPRSDRRRFLH